MTEEYIIRKIGELMPSGNRVPQGVLYSHLKRAVQRDLAEVLGVLLKSKRLRYNKTLNDILININNNNNEQEDNIQEP